MAMSRCENCGNEAYRYSAYSSVCYECGCPYGSRVPESELLRSLIEYVVARDRVCPLPQRWNTMYSMLPIRQLPDGAREPQLPLILGGWNASDSAKGKVLRCHLNYAAVTGRLVDVDSYLRGLSEDDWHHSYD